MIDRRSVVAMLAGAGPIAASSVTAPPETPEAPDIVAAVRAFLGRAVDGSLPDYLRLRGARGPRIQAMTTTASTESAQFPRLDAAAAELRAGSYIISPEQGRVEARLMLATREPVVARFTVASGPDGPQVASVDLAAADDTAFFVSVAAAGGIERRDGNQSAAVQAQYDRLAAAGGGTLYFPAGDYRINLQLTHRNVHLRGAGSTVSRLRPADSGRPVLQALYNSGSWDRVTVASIGLVGTGSGTGFLAGHESFQPDDQFAGRTLFHNVRWEAFDTCIVRASGQIGLWLRDCQFEAAQYHLVCRDHVGPGEQMHAGVMTARDCHFSGATKAVVRIAGSVTGSGQILFDTCIFEQNSGHVLLVEALNNKNATPALTLRSCWNEQNATAATVEIDGHRVRPVFGSFADTGMILFEDTPLGSVKMRSATIKTVDCPLDAFTIVATDQQSTVVHRDARGFGSFQPQGLVSSVAAAYQFLPNRALTFAMPSRRRGMQPAGKGDLLLGDTAGPLATAAGGSISVSGERRWIVAAGQRSRLAREVTAPAASWLVWLFHYRNISGAGARLEIGGGLGISSATLTSNVPLSLAGMTFLPDGAQALSFYLEASPQAGSTIAVGAVNLAQFSTRQAALDFLNADYWLERTK